MFSIPGAGVSSLLRFLEKESSEAKLSAVASSPQVDTLHRWIVRTVKAIEKVRPLFVSMQLEDVMCTGTDSKSKKGHVGLDDVRLEEKKSGEEEAMTFDWISRLRIDTRLDSAAAVLSGKWWRLPAVQCAVHSHHCRSLTNAHNIAHWLSPETLQRICDPQFVAVGKEYERLPITDTGVETMFARIDHNPFLYHNVTSHLKQNFKRTVKITILGDQYELSVCLNLFVA